MADNEPWDLGGTTVKERAADIARWIASERRQIDAAEFELDHMRARIERAEVQLRKLRRQRARKVKA